MKAFYEKVSHAGVNSFGYSCFSLPRFNAPFHYHPELELTLIEKSQGKRLVGGHVAHYEAGDLVLLGPNVPHCWLNAEAEPPAADAAQAIVIHFRADFAGETFLALPELLAIQQLFQKAQAGLLIKGKTRDIVAEKMRSGLHLQGFPRLLLLFDLLHCIALSSETERIDLLFSQQVLSPIETERFQKIYTFLIENFRENISLEQMAQIANLSPTAFCRYFKKITRKTFVDALTEFRIKHACQLLAAGEKPVQEICFESGFGNVSYFNKEFKKALGQTPLQYRKYHLSLPLVASRS